MGYIRWFVHQMKVPPPGKNTPTLLGPFTSRKVSKDGHVFIYLRVTASKVNDKFRWRMYIPDGHGAKTRSSATFYGPVESIKQAVEAVLNKAFPDNKDLSAQVINLMHEMKKEWKTWYDSLPD